MSLPKHMPALDGLRGIAILMVVLTHSAGGRWAASSITQDPGPFVATFSLPWWLSSIAGHATHGVTLFFVVSAFTLTVQAGRREDSLVAYALRRLARVAPGYWLAGLIYTMWAGLTPRLWAQDGLSIADLIIAALFGSAWQGGASLAVVPGGWSVCCEVAFYIALPVLLWIIQGRLWRVLALAVLACVGVQLAARYYMMHGGWHYVPDYISPWVQLPAFLLGIAAALVATRLPRLPGVSLALLMTAICGLPLVAAVITEWRMLPHLAFATLAASSVALSASHPPLFLTNRFIRKIGNVSYSLYLVYFIFLAPCLALAELLLPGDRWPTLMLHFGLTAACSFAVATLTYRWIELPSIRWMASQLNRRSGVAFAG